MPKIDIRETGSINQTLMPLQMSETRMVTKTVSVLYKTEKSPIVFREADETEVMEVEKTSFPVCSVVKAIPTRC